MDNPIKLFVATKAFIVKDGKVLVLREASDYKDGTNPGKYDIVGGRIEPGERYDDALRREVFEETGLEVEVGKPFAVNEWRPTPHGEQWQIVAIFFECTYQGGEITLSVDHDGYEWLDPKEYQDFPIMENLKSVFESFNNK